MPNASRYEIIRKIKYIYQLNLDSNKGDFANNDFYVFNSY